MKSNPFVYISLIAVFLFSNIAFGDIKKNSGLQHENYKKITLEQKNNQMNLLGLSKPSSGPTKIDAIKKGILVRYNSQKVNSQKVELNSLLKGMLAKAAREGKVPVTPNQNNGDSRCVDCQGNDCTGYEYWVGDGWCDDG